MATITATQRVVNNHLTNFNYHHLSSVIKYLNNQQQHQQQHQPTQQVQQQTKTWTTTNALSISQRYFEKIAPAAVGIPALMNQNFYDMQVYSNLYLLKYFLQRKMFRICCNLIVVYRIQAQMPLVMMVMGDTEDTIGTKNQYFSVPTVTKGIGLKRVYLYTSA